MRLIILLINSSLNHFFGTVVLYLFSKIAQVFDVIVLFHFIIMSSDNVLLPLLPPKLILLKNPRFLEFVAFLLKPRLSLLVASLDVFDVVSPLRMCMIINSERTLGSHKIRICLRMILWWNILPLKRQTNHIFNIELLLLRRHKMTWVRYRIAILPFSVCGHGSFT
jgi:hypothetical protein